MLSLGSGDNVVLVLVLLVLLVGLLQRLDDTHRGPSRRVGLDSVVGGVVVAVVMVGVASVLGGGCSQITIISVIITAG